MSACQIERPSCLAPRSPMRGALLLAALFVSATPAALLGRPLPSGTPHPAVVRISVPEADGTAYGSGTLVDVRDEYGLVLTNWHVVCDASGPIEVRFPGGFVSQARPLKVDRDWDLAALVIWRPPCQPVRLASGPPRPGDRLTICGYGAGNYRAVAGRCTQYYAPRINLPQHLVELDVEARQGDSGGPIFNDRGELAGVLFGAGQGTTLGSFEGRVKTFLASLAPDIGQPHGGDAPQVAWQPIGPTRPEGMIATGAAGDRTGRGATSRCAEHNPAASLVSTSAARAATAERSRPRDADDESAAADFAAAADRWPKPSEAHGWTAAGREPHQGASDAWANGDTDSSPAAGVSPKPGAADSPSWNLWESVKNILAGIGAVALLMQLVRLAG